MNSTSIGTGAMPGFFTGHLAERDPEVFKAIGEELHRQQDQIELIASENIVSRAVLEAQGSVLTNKYAEGYPGRRYYGGCEFVDVAEALAIERAKKLFACNFANVQPHSGAQANQAVLLRPAAARRHLHGAEPRRGRASDPWLAGQPVGQMVQGRCPIACGARISASTWTRSSAWPRSTSRSSSWPAARPIRASGISSASARSPIPSAPISWSTWRISPGWWRAASIRARCPMPMW